MTAPAPKTAYAELASASNFSFLRGASHPKDLVLTAILRGHTGLGLADRNTVAGVVRAWSALRSLREDGLAPPEVVRDGAGPGEVTYVEDPLNDPALSEEVKRRAATFKLATGARLAFNDGAPDIIAYPETRAGWGRLTRLLTLGNRRAVKGQCEIGLHDLIAAAEGLLLIVMPGGRLEGLERTLNQLAQAAPGAVWLGVAMGRGGDDRRRLARLKRLAGQGGVPLLAVNDVLYHDAGQRDLQDVLTCIREGVTIEAAGRRLNANGERWLKPPAEMLRLFRDAPEAVAETANLLARVGFDLGDIRYQYPEETTPPGQTPQAWLEHLTWRHAEMRYCQGVPDTVGVLLKKELAFIAKANYAPYFLTIYDIVRVARDKRILCQGRGSAANSAVCYVLGITAVDPAESDLLFERFLSSDRGEPPDIDVDFEHERREEVIQHIYERYGRARAGIAATVIRYRPKSAIRDVGKALGLTEDVTARLASSQWGSWGSEIGDRHVEQAGLDPANPMIRRAVAMASRLLGFPRHLSQHVGGFVLTQGPLVETVPIGNAAMEDRTFIEWDKDDIDELRIMKVDVLALGMLTAIRRSFDMIARHYGPRLDLMNVPRERQRVYRMLCKADSLGVFQVESRAQMAMLPRLMPTTFYDLVVQVAIVRPGPIQGDMVHPYLTQRRLRREAAADQRPFDIDYPKPAPEHGEPDELRKVLHKTLGVPLFQEQAMRIAMEAAKFTGDEANGLRRAMATFRHVGTISTYEEKLVGRMIARGYDPEFARNCFNQIKGFGEYGFPESHAAAFAQLVYVSSWLKCVFPEVFAAGLLNSQPMGFYAPAQIVRDARGHGVEVRHPDVNESEWDCTLQPRPGRRRRVVRLGLRQIGGFRQAWAEALCAARAADGPFESIDQLRSRAALPPEAIDALAEADALGSLKQNRRTGLWNAKGLPRAKTAAPLFEAAGLDEGDPTGFAHLPTSPVSEEVVADYQTIRLSLKDHPMRFLRERMRGLGAIAAREMEEIRDKRRAAVAGVVLVRQRPGSSKGVVFMTIEDETGVANVVVWPKVFDQFRPVVMGARLVLVRGYVQRADDAPEHPVIHLVAQSIEDLTADLDLLSAADPARNAAPGGRHPRDVRVIPKSRDFH